MVQHDPVGGVGVLCDDRTYKGLGMLTEKRADRPTTDAAGRLVEADRHRRSGSTRIFDVHTDDGDRVSGLVN